MTVISNPLLLKKKAAAGGGGASGYQIEKSVRLNRDDEAYFSRTPAIKGNRRTWTWSGWVKRVDFGDGASKQSFIWSSIPDLNPYFQAYFYNNKLSVDIDGAGVEPTRLFRDPSAWMHIVIAVDTTQTTAAERLKLYINGHLETDFGSDTRSNIGLNEETNINSTDIHTIGSQQTHTSVDAHVYLSDVQLIDGLQLSAAAFGEFDSNTGVWNPKAFALPAPNNGTTWSSSLTNDQNNGFNNSTSAANLFDGVLTTEISGNGNFTFTPPGNGIAFSQAVEVYYDYGSNAGGEDEDAKINGGNWIRLKHQQWTTLSEGSGTLTSLKFRDYRGTNFDTNGPRAVRVDGVVLIDGQNDPTTKNNLNDGTKWSDYITGATINSTTYGLANAFNGKVSTAYDDGNNTCPNDNTTCVFKPPNTITAEKSLRVFFWRYAAGAAVYQNNTDITSTIAAATGNSGGGWATLSDKTINTTHGLTWSRVTNGQDFRLAAIEVDGVILEDSTDDNSFHLKFNDTALNRYLGKDTLNGKLADATGGLPIYKTTDDYGDTKGSGYRADSNKSNLVLAVTGEGSIADVSHVSDLRNSGSAKSLSAQGDTAISTDDSRFYGSSIKFDGTGDYLTLSDSTDFEFGTGDYTIECWVKHTSISAQQTYVSDTGGNSAGVYFYKDTNHKLGLYYGAQIITGSTALAVNNWYHIAVVRNSGTSKLYLNGVEDGSASDTNNLTVGNLAFGAHPDGSGNLFSGYMQELRVYKGAAKYTANFKPPTRNDWSVTNLSGSDPGAADVDYISSGNAKVWKTLYEGSGKIESIKADSSHSSSTQNYQNWYGVRIDGTHLNESGTEYSEDVTSNTGSFYGSNTAPKLFDGDESTNVDASAGGGWVKWTPDGGHSFNSKIEVLHHPGGSNLVFTYKLESDAAGIDSLVDTPTNYGEDTGAGGEVRGNYATLNPLQKKDSNLSQGNLFGGNTANTDGTAYATIRCPASGVWYCEATFEEWTAGGNNFGIGVDTAQTRTTSEGLRAFSNTDAKSRLAGFNDTHMFSCPGSGGGTNIGTLTLAKGDVWQCCWDVDNGKLYYGKNNTWYTSSGPSSGAAFNASNHFFSEEFLKDGGFFYLNGFDATGWINFGQRAWKYTPPLNAKALCTQNLPDTFSGEAAGTVNNPSSYFDIATYTGTQVAGTNIKGLNFQPDFVWIKERNNATNHALFDSVRGVQKFLRSNDTSAETSDDHSITAFNSDGFTMGTGNSSAYINREDNTYVAWNWDAGTTSWSSSDSDVTAGTFASSGYTNRTAGFSIVTWEGDETNTPTGTVGHNLGAKPELIMIKNADGATHWVVGHDYTSTPWSTWLYLNTNDDEESDTSKFNATAPTSTVFSIGQSGATNGDNSTFIGYCWTPINGYSAFGKYTGNANADGPFVYTGFRPRWFLMKELDDATNWLIYDSERNVSNPTSFYLFPNTNAGGNTYEAANTNLPVDFLSNGFKLRNNNSGTNASGDTYVWAAFAEHPFKIARAR